MHRLFRDSTYRNNIASFFYGNGIKKCPLKSVYNYNDNNYITNSSYDVAHNNRKSNNNDSLKKEF